MRGNDTEEVSGLGPDPGDQAILERAKAERRVLITSDTDFGFLVYAGGLDRAGLVRLPDVPAARRIEIVSQLLESHAQELVAGAVITVKGGWIRMLGITRASARSLPIKPPIAVNGSGGAHSVRMIARTSAA